VWASDIELDDFNHVYSASNPKPVYLGKKNTVWASTNYVGAGETLVVTPVSAYFTFSPAQLTFTSGTLRVPFTATAIALSPSNPTAINYVLSGSAAGYYMDIPAQSVYIFLRSLSWWEANLAIDNREFARVVHQDDASFPTVLTQNHVTYFSLMTSALVDSDLTITPKSPHVSFSPSSITFKSSNHISLLSKVLLNAVNQEIDNNKTVIYPTYVHVANFSVKAAAPGLHDVHFELSGTDAPYYDFPNHQYMLFNIYSGDSSIVAASLVSVVLAVVAVLAL